MEQLQRIWNASLLGRLVTALCLSAPLLLAVALL